MYNTTKTVDSLESLENNFDDALSSITEEELKAEISFIGSDSVVIKTTNAQELFNYYQTFPKVMVMDMRSKAQYESCRMKWSVNFPIDSFKSSDFINFDPTKIIEKHLVLDVDKEMFKTRKRSIIVIVAHRVSTTRIYPFIHQMFDPDGIATLKTQFAWEDILAMRNAVLLYTALK